MQSCNTAPKRTTRQSPRGIPRLYIKRTPHGAAEGAVNKAMPA
jgi:hypothetical protein